MPMKKRFAHKENILLVNITRLGDMLQATPTIAGMKMENPNCKVSVVVEKQFESICKVIPNVDEVVSIDLGMTVRSLAREGEGIIDGYEYVTEFVDKLRSQKFDYCLNMSSSAYTAMLLNLVGIKRNGGWTSDDEGYRVIESDWARLFATSVFHQNRQFNSLNLVDVFRCSADVEEHPHKLVLEVPSKDLEFARSMISEARFTNTGPLIAVQAGASQQKRQWAPANFIELVKILVNEHNARVLLIGTKKELQIINPIVAGVESPNVFVAAGKTDIPQLSALLKISDVLVTGDTGPMHISVAVGTPVVSMFLASAFGFETGPYSEGNIVLQPVIGCGPCNPNKPCSRPDCHETVDPRLVAELSMMRLKGDIRRLPQDMPGASQVVIYRTFFDDHGFFDMEALSGGHHDRFKPMRDAYRKLWLDDLAGYQVSATQSTAGSTRSLGLLREAVPGLDEVVRCAEHGLSLISELNGLIRDVRAPAHRLGEVNNQLTELDRLIEELGFHHSSLGPVTRMFMFAKENLSGTEAGELASQMSGVYADLKRRCQKLGTYYC